MDYEQLVKILNESSKHELVAWILLMVEEDHLDLAFTLRQWNKIAARRTKSSSGSV